MRVVLVNYGGDFSRLRAPEDVLEAFHTLTGWADGLRQAGADVIVIQGFRCDASLERDGVRYEMVAGPFSPRLPRWRQPRRLHRLVGAVEPDVVHVNSLLYSLQTWGLRRLLPPRTVLVMQHHAERPGRWWTRPLDRLALRACDGFLFTGRETARPWLEAGLIAPDRPIFELAEGSSRFKMGERERARGRTGMDGDPVFLWVAHLDANKDPLTVLSGLEPVFAKHPSARLYMVFRGDELLGDVRRRIVGSALLRGKVDLRGAVPYDELEPYFNSADVFVQGSHREGSGYALLDALACGVVPVVTEIPSFCFLTGDGKVGALWRCGDAEDLTVQLRRVLSRPIAPQRRAARQWFEERMSFSALGRQALAAYDSLLDQRRLKTSR